MSNLYRLFGYLRPYSSRMVGAVCAMLVVAASTATITYLAKPIFDEALQQQVDRDFLFRLAAVLVFMYLVLGVARFLCCLSELTAMTLVSPVV